MRSYKALVNEQWRLDIEKYSCSPRISISGTNCLSFECVNASIVDMFIHNIDEYIKDAVLYE